MIARVKIDNFKCLHNENLEFKPFTIITGLNSTGKSSLIQSILFPLAMNGRGSSLLNDIMTFSYESLRNKYKNSQQMSCEYELKEGAVSFSTDNSDVSVIDPSNFDLDLETNIYYLSANRTGVENSSKISPIYSIGVNGEYILGTFEKEKSTALREKLIKDNNSVTLSTQVNYWLSYITGIPTELQTEKRLNDVVETSFKSDGLNNLSPSSIGAGVSYLAKILISCLRAKEDDIVIIENPEIHLHPASQSKMGEFFAFIANANIQIIIETHCEHLINRVAYEIYKKRFDANDVTVFYKKGIQDKFNVIEFKKDGKFSDDFPEGFFDATLSELIEME